MRYEAEELAATLKAVRERSGISQRALSARAGVPQSHISKIERGHVNLTVSSLTAIANALDLDIALVPRQAMPAVNAICRSTGDARHSLPEVRKELARIAKQLENLKTLGTEMSAYEDLHRKFRELRQFEHLIKDKDTLISIKKNLKAIGRTRDGHVRLGGVAQQIADLSNALAHGGMRVDQPRSPRPAYRLEEDDDD